MFVRHPHLQQVRQILFTNMLLFDWALNISISLIAAYNENQDKMLCFGFSTSEVWSFHNVLVFAVTGFNVLLLVSHSIMGVITLLTFFKDREKIGKVISGRQKLVFKDFVVSISPLVSWIILSMMFAVAGDVYTSYQVSFIIEFTLPFNSFVNPLFKTFATQQFWDMALRK